MRLLCLCKRRPQGRDLFTQPYGRFYHLPRLLAERGHEVHLLLLGYRREPAAQRREGKLHWHAVSALPWGPLPYLTMAGRLAAELKPDWVVGLSDTWYGILAERLARPCGARTLIDAYDNYESYIPWLKPLHGLWRRALARADAVTAAGPQLAEWMGASAGGRPVAVVPMAADPAFTPLDKQVCRQRLGLPSNAHLVGYTGALHPNRGIELLFQIFEKLKTEHPRVELVLSGRLARGITLPLDIHWLGYRPAEDIPLVLNSLDLLFVINKPGPFGDFSYPAKLYEALACGVPVVASDVSGVAWILQNHSECLAMAGNTDDFVAKAKLALYGSWVLTGQTAGWQYSADILESQLLTHESKPTYSGH